MEAKILKNFIPVVAVSHFGLRIDVPNGWDDVKKICKKVLEFDGKKYVFTGWNSDRNEVFFRQGQNFAKIV